ncbi:MAG: acyl-CoA dehydrogenase [Gammaproteobacteria bacterium]|nr:acyl-CoA dehydrogenase [Gammaproteobacteria bacterium]
MSLLVNPRDLDFLLYELLDAEVLLATEIYGHHDRETFNAVLASAERLAEDLFAPHAARLDANEPSFDGERVYIIPEVKAAIDAYIESGFMGMAASSEYGGMQLPWVVTQAACAWFMAADVAANAYAFLTHAAINLLSAFGSEAQKQRYLVPMIEGRYFGTMCLSEPQAGSSLSDIQLRAEPTAAGHYLIKGTKMWISGGEQELSENIVHLVLAKIPGGPPGVKGISLFVVPKYRVADDGSLGAKNNIVLAGLNHKMGYRGTTNTVLNFGESGECHGWLVGEANQGLSYMFHMMNEARIGVGMTATMSGYTGYLHSLQYARERPQGRLPQQKDPGSPQVPIIQHADIKRLLLAQKAAAEGALSLALYCAWLLDRQRGSTDDQERRRLGLLLDILTPIAKSWPSEFCLEGNKHAIQILGGYGYTREFPLERFYRDNRLNAIHEGTHGIQGIDLLGRKVSMQDGAAWTALLAEYRATLDETAAVAELAEYRGALAAAVDTLAATTRTLVDMRAAGEVNRALANATLYLDAFGHVVIAWMWLRQALVAVRALPAAAGSDVDFYRGKLQACRYFYRYELPKVAERCALLADGDDTCLSAAESWF